VFKIVGPGINFYMKFDSQENFCDDLIYETGRQGPITALIQSDKLENLAPTEMPYLYGVKSGEKFL